jgi:hypothetical protein
VRYLRGAALGRLGFCTGWAVDSHGKNKEWVEIVHHNLHLPHLKSELQGRRLIHISDLHCSATVSGKYLSRCVARINKLEPDIIVLTGDYITCDLSGRFREKLVTILADLKSRSGIYACMGNHDYGLDGADASVDKGGLRDIMDGLSGIGINVLRNSSSVLEIEGRPISFVGMGDLWADDFEPEKAFRKLHDRGPVIGLAHNPNAIKYLKGYKLDALMCGHTHGVSLQLSPSLKWPILNRHDYHAGMYHVGSKKLYVNRGLGRLGKAFFNARPEITVFNLC